MVDITGTFSQAFNYAKQDYKKLLIVGIICILANLTVVLRSFGITGSILSIGGIIGFIFALVIAGYGLSIIKENISLSKIIPDFDWGDNIVNGIKLWILEIVYFLIPVIILIVIGAFTIDGNAVQSLMNYISYSSNATIPANLIEPVLTSLGIVSIVAFILAVIFGLMAFVGTCRLAKTDSLSEGLNFKKVISDIGNIGIGSLIAWIILLLIILIVFGIIELIIMMIPYVGTLISTLIISPFILLFMNSAIGRLYSQI